MNNHLICIGLLLSFSACSTSHYYQRRNHYYQQRTNISREKEQLMYSSNSQYPVSSVLGASENLLSSINSNSFQDEIASISGITVDEETGVSSISQSVLFPFDSSSPREESIPIIEAVSKAFIALEPARIEIYGHTDNIGSETYNQALSDRRAAAIAKLLVGRFGVSSENIKWYGFGEKNPIADNSTESGRSKNRRVEFKVIR